MTAARARAGDDALLSHVAVGEEAGHARRDARVRGDGVVPGVARREEPARPVRGRRRGRAGRREGHVGGEQLPVDGGDELLRRRLVGVLRGDERLAEGRRGPGRGIPERRGLGADVRLRRVRERPLLVFAEARLEEREGLGAREVRRRDRRRRELAEPPRVVEREPGREKRDSSSLQRGCSARARSGKRMHASIRFQEMIARPKISQNEWKTAEI